MPKITFDQSPRFVKQCKKFLDKHPTFQKDLEQAKRLISAHFDEDNTFKFSDTVLCNDSKVKYRQVYKLRKLAVAGLRPGQCPRLWIRLHNNEIVFLLFMDSHINNYSEAEAVKEITQILKDLDI